MKKWRKRKQADSVARLNIRNVFGLFDKAASLAPITGRGFAGVLCDEENLTFGFYRACGWMIVCGGLRLCLCAAYAALYLHDANTAADAGAGDRQRWTRALSAAFLCTVGADIITLPFDAVMVIEKTETR